MGACKRWRDEVSSKIFTEKNDIFARGEVVFIKNRGRPLRTAGQSQKDKKINMKHFPLIKNLTFLCLLIPNHI